MPRLRDRSKSKDGADDLSVCLPMRIMNALADRLAKSATRGRALELVLVAQVALDRTCLEGRRAPNVSAVCRYALDSIAATPTAMPVDAAGAYIALWQIQPHERAAAAALVEEAMALTAADLGFLGRETLFVMVGALPLKHRKTRTRADLEAEIALSHSPSAPTRAIA